MSTEISPKNNIKEILEKSNLSTNKRLGQNFLHDQNIINKMIDSGSITKEDTVVEIGPGLGTITFPLSQNAKQIICIEKDPKIHEWLSLIMQEKGINNVNIIKGDALIEIEKPTSELNKIIPKTYKIIANIPYYLTSRIIRLLLENNSQPQLIVLMIQKEVAERICDKKNNSLLSISVSYYAESKIKHIVSRNCFHPKPKVDSAIILITPHNIKREKTFNKEFFRILKAGFSCPRKQLIKNLSQIGDRSFIKKILVSNNISPSQRAETLSLNDWINITTQYISEKS